MANVVAANLDFENSARIVNLPAGTTTGHPVTYEQLNAAIEGLAHKDNVRVATQANVDLSSPGATVDGISLVASDRVLVRAQTTASQNGVYIWNGAAIPMTRALDASTALELESAIVPVDEGSSGGQNFRQTAVNFTLDTDPVTWVAFGTAAGAASETSAGIAEIATQAEADAGTDDVRFLTPLKFANIAGRVRKFSANIGDGTATQYDVTHNLGTRDVHVTVYRNSGNFDSVIADTERFSTNVVRIKFAVAPTLNAYRVVVHG